MTTGSHASPIFARRRPLELFHKAHLGTPSGPLCDRTENYGGEFRASWQRGVALRFERLSFPPASTIHERGFGNRQSLTQARGAGLEGRRSEHFSLQSSVRLTCPAFLASLVSFAQITRKWDGFSRSSGVARRTTDRVFGASPTPSSGRRWTTHARPLRQPELPSSPQHDHA